MDEYVPLEKEEEIDELRKGVRYFYEAIPINLHDHPQVQEECLAILYNVELTLDDSRDEISNLDMINSRMMLTQVLIKMMGAKMRSWVLLILFFIIAIFASILILLYYFGILTYVEAAELNSYLIMGIPLPVWIWSIIGSLTSMLLRAGQTPFKDRTEAIR